MQNALIYVHNVIDILNDIVFTIKEASSGDCF